MNDTAIIEMLRSEEKQLTAVELAELLNKLTNGRLSQQAIVTYFKRAFPSIPLQVLLDAGAWNRVGAGGLCDADFNELLNPWLGSSR